LHFYPTPPHQPSTYTVDVKRKFTQALQREKISEIIRKTVPPQNVLDYKNGEKIIFLTIMKKDCMVGIADYKDFPDGFNIRVVIDGPIKHKKNPQKKNNKRNK